MKPITKNLCGILHPVKTGTAPGLEDGLYLVRFRNHIGQVVDQYVAVVAETEVGGTMLYDELGNHLTDTKVAVKIPDRKSISEVAKPGSKSVIGIYFIPDSAERAVKMGRAHGVQFEA